MAFFHLRNYLKSNRKRLSFSQDEVAYLLGIQSGSEICRHERFLREPSLATALAYEAVFQKPVRELFAGLYCQIEADVAERIKVMATKVGRQNDTRLVGEKLKEILGSIAVRSRETLNEQ